MASRSTDAKLQELLERFKKINLSDRTKWSNQTLNFARELYNMLILARVITLGALARNESRGAHYKPDFPERDDANWLKTTRAKWVNGADPVEYDPVDISLLPPRHAVTTWRSSAQAKQARVAGSEDLWPKQKSIVRVKRQQSPDRSPALGRIRADLAPAHERHHLPARYRRMARHAATAKPPLPITYDSNCLEEICGSCAMVINGKVRMACSALVDHLDQPIRIEPMTKFPVVRDLAVDRTFMFENLKRVKAWIPIDGTYDLGEGPKMAPEVQEKAYPLSRCIILRRLPGSLSAGERAIAISWARPSSARCGFSTCIRPARCTRTSASKP